MRGLPFVPTGNPGGDFYRGGRDASDHYGSSAVALEAATGRVERPAAPHGGGYRDGVRSGLRRAAMDDSLRAYDVETGEELWRGRLPAGGQAPR